MQLGVPYTQMMLLSRIPQTSSDVMCTVVGSATTRCEKAHMKLSVESYPSDSQPTLYPSMSHVCAGPSPCSATTCSPALCRWMFVRWHASQYLMCSLSCLRICLTVPQ